GNDWYRFGRHAKFIHQTTSDLQEGMTYDSGTDTYIYSYGGITDTVSASASNLITSSFTHSWRNDSQNNHTQFGINTAYSHRFSDLIGITIGGEARYWDAEHNAQSFDFSFTDLSDPDAFAYYNEAQRRYHYDGIVTNLAGFARIMIYPIPAVTIMLDGQYASYNSKVEETPLQAFDFGAGKFTSTTYLPTQDLVDSDGNPLYTEDQYERTFSFFQPKAGLNWNINKNWNVYGNFGIAKKEPKVGDWYSRTGGPGANQLDELGNIVELTEETLTNYEGGIGFYNPNARVTVNYFYSKFEDKIESVELQNGEFLTINAGNATHHGLELAANGAYSGWDASLSLTIGTNTWDDMNLNEIFGFPAEDVVGKVVPFAPENMYHAGIGYSFTPQFRIGIDGTAWDNYFGNYDNTAKLKDYFALNAVVEYAFLLAGSRVDLRFDAYNITGREQFTNAAWDRDFNRTDDKVGTYFMNVMQAPLQHYFITATVTIL
ncbi:MAG: TonB-dependent receptor, partial [Thermodesulfovibrionia bacterium]|nr:TonB-dependent receptor [Thermodesulfovibrionia bacterium]